MGTNINMVMLSMDKPNINPIDNINMDTLIL
jgi:hypothetical protein